MQQHINHFIRLANWLERTLEARARACIAFYQQRRAFTVLSTFGDRELKDIGIYRGQIESAVKGRLPDAALAEVPLDRTQGARPLAA